MLGLVIIGVGLAWNYVWLARVWRRTDIDASHRSLDAPEIEMYVFNFLITEDR